MNDKDTLENEETSEGTQVPQITENASTPGTEISRSQDTNRADKLIVGGAWLIAVSLVMLFGYLAWQTRIPFAVANASEAAPGNLVAGEAPLREQGEPQVSPELLEGEYFDLPPFQPVVSLEGISRRTELYTVIPTRPRATVITYTVTAGDSVFSISKKFNIKPETVLWANYGLLKDSPETLSIGMELFIPAADGVYYEWKEGDTFEIVAALFKATAEDIINWPGNDIDIVEPTVEPGQMVLVPGGTREMVQWIVPTIPRTQAGVSKAVYGPGACEGSYDGYYGSGGFVWPTVNRVLSGNDYWSGHLGLDIAAGMGAAIYAADSGVVVFAGWTYGGYGNMIMVDHGNGYQTVYAHLSNVGVQCGQSVNQGRWIGGSGSTGNSTGPHLHFEVRYMGGFVNPWHVLP